MTSLRFSLKRAGALLLLLGLTACGLNLVKLAPASNLYDLNTNPQFAGNIPGVTWQLVIDEPVASRALDTDRIVVRPNPSEITYLADAKWTERAPRLVQSQLIHAFERSGKIVGIGREAMGLRADYELNCELRAFEISYAAGRALPVAHILLTAKLVRQPGAVIVASRTFDESQKVEGTTLPMSAAAFEKALNKMLGEAVAWTLSVGQADFAGASDRPAQGARHP
jgi:cholesterol transport system auxiliary component